MYLCWLFQRTIISTHTSGLAPYLCNCFYSLHLSNFLLIITIEFASSVLHFTVKYFFLMPPFIFLSAKVYQSVSYQLLETTSQLILHLQFLQFKCFYQILDFSARVETILASLLRMVIPHHWIYSRKYIQQPLKCQQLY